MSERLVVSEESSLDIVDALTSQLGLTLLGSSLSDNSTISGAIRCRDSVSNADSLRNIYVECEKRQDELIDKITSNILDADRGTSQKVKGR
ncbi:MAG: hypothetical protein J6U54_12110 [Clostridiales bacterium]|nr:hypothetical protein [Clostridiales bacterium]